MKFVNGVCETFKCDKVARCEKKYQRSIYLKIDAIGEEITNVKNGSINV